MVNKVFNLLQCLKPLQAFHKVHTKPTLTVFSGIQPTGVPHLGNYFGAIRQWRSLQDEGNKCIFSIVDLHAITLPQDPKVLRHNIRVMAASLMACGIDPQKSVLFLQSQVPQHAELCWILQTMITMARLSHLPQYKEKSGSSENVPLGLFTYPILQAADILIYKATHVPVGEDQLQHIQLCQHLAKVFNNKFGNIFPFPQPLIGDNSARIKSLKQPDKKMSKSDLESKNRIEITDPPQTVMKRISQSLTDFISEVTYDPVNRPGVSNLVRIHSLSTGLTFEEICKQSAGLDTGKFKKVVGEALVECLRPIREEFGRLVREEGYVDRVLEKGAESAREKAELTMREVKEAVGLSLKGRS